LGRVAENRAREVGAAGSHTRQRDRPANRARNNPGATGAHPPTKRVGKQLICEDCGITLEADAADCENAARRLGWRLFF